MPDPVDALTDRLIASERLIETLRAELRVWQQRFGDCEGALRVLQDRQAADAETWRRMWNDADLMAYRAEALRDGTADLGGDAVPRRDGTELPLVPHELSGSGGAASPEPTAP